MKRITLVLLLLTVLLYGCYGGGQNQSDASLIDSSIDSETDPVERAYSETDEQSTDDYSVFNSRYEPPKDESAFTYLKSLEEIILLCPQLAGSWHCGRHITTAKLFGNNVEAIDFLYDSDGFDVSFSETEIMICGNKYAMRVFPFGSTGESISLDKNATYYELCRQMGYPEHEKLPLSNNQTYDCFRVNVQNTDEAAGAEMDFQVMIICMYDDNKLLLDIDDIIFIAERATNH